MIHLGLKKLKEEEKIDILEEIWAYRSFLKEWKSKPSVPGATLIGPKSCGKQAIVRMAHEHDESRTGNLDSYNPEVDDFDKKIDNTKGGTLGVSPIEKTPKDIQWRMYYRLRTENYGPNIINKPDTRFIACSQESPYKIRNLLLPELFWLLRSMVLFVKPVRFLLQHDFRKTIQTVAFRMLYRYDLKEVVHGIPDEVPEDVVGQIMDFDWPDNLRQLQCALMQVGIDEDWGTIKKFMDFEREYQQRSIKLDDAYKILFDNAKRMRDQGKKQGSLIDSVADGYQQYAIDRCVQEYGYKPALIGRVIGESTDRVSHRKEYSNSKEKKIY